MPNEVGGPPQPGGPQPDRPAAPDIADLPLADVEVPAEAEQGRTATDPSQQLRDEEPKDARGIPAALPYPSIRQSLSIVGISILLDVVCSPIMALGTRIGDEAASLVYYLSACGLLFSIAHSIRKRKQGSSSYDFRIASWRLVPPLILGTVGLLFGVVAPIAGLIPMPGWAMDDVKGAASETGLLAFLGFVIAPPLLEELTFRGIMLDGLLRRYGPLTSIVISSLCFGFVHLNPWQFVTGFVLGCFLGWVYSRSGSLGPCILIHMSANLSGYLLRLLVPFDATGDGPGGIPGPFLVALEAALLTASLLAVVLLRREFNKHRYIAVGLDSATGGSA